MNEVNIKERVKTPQPIVLKNERVVTEISPLGAFLSTLVIDGEELIYRPREDNPKRGGIPVLGPTPGPIKGQKWEVLYPKMPQHGSDRETLWNVTERSDTSVTFSRHIGPKEFLFAGQITIEVKLVNNGVCVTKRITNFEDKPREIGHALHPYFATNGEELVFAQEELQEVQPLKKGKPEVKRGFDVITFNRGESKFEIRSNPRPIQTVVWSDNPKLYQCIEPWWATAGTGDSIDTRSSKSYEVEIVKTK